MPGVVLAAMMSALRRRHSAAFAMPVSRKIVNVVGRSKRTSPSKPVLVDCWGRYRYILVKDVAARVIGSLRIAMLEGDQNLIPSFRLGERWENYRKDTVGPTCG